MGKNLNKGKIFLNFIYWISMHMYYSLQDLTGESQFSNYDSKHYWDSFVASVELPINWISEGNGLCFFC